MKQIERMYADIRNVAFLEPSPNGTKILYGVSGADLAKDRMQNWLWLYDIKTRKSRQLTFAGCESGGGWLDDDTIFYTEGKEGKTAFYSLSIFERQAKPMFELDIPGAEAVCLGPDKFVICGLKNISEPGEGKNELYDIYDEYPYHYDGRGYVNKMRTGLWIFEKGELKPITGKNFHANQKMNSGAGPIVSPDKKRVYFYGGDIDVIDSPTPDIYVYDVEKGESTLLYKNETHQFMTGFEFEGRAYFLGYKVAPDLGADFLTEQIISVAAGESGCRVELSPEDTVDNAVACGDRILVIFGEHDRSNIYSWMPGSEPELLCSPRHYVKSDLFPCADGIYYVGAAPMKVNELVRIKFGRDEAVTDLTSEELRGYEISPNEPLSVRSDEGHIIHGWVMKPHGYVSGNKYPGLLMIHGGPQSAYLDTLNVSMQRYAEAGYFIFFCNPRGSTNYGHDYMDVVLKYGITDYKDIMNFTDAVLKAYPEIDPDRLGVTGGSYGGYMSNWIVGQTDRFKAAVPQRSISNWVSLFGCTDTYYFTKWSEGGTPWDGFDELWKHSPLKYANNFKTPTLLLQNERDYRCPVEQAEQMLTALIERGVPCRMVLFHNASHSVMKPSQKMINDREIISWLDKYVK